MKKIYLILLAAAFAVSTHAQKMRVWYDGIVEYQKSITQIDSITFVDEEEPDPDGYAKPAIIKGRVVYDAGAVLMTDGTIEKGLRSIEGIEVVVSVRFHKGSFDEKVQLYTAKTDAKGYFSLAIPSLEAGFRYDAELTVKRFNAQYVGEVNGQRVPCEAIYEKSSPIMFSIKANEITHVTEGTMREYIFAERIYVGDMVAEEWTYEAFGKSQTLNVTGELKIQAEELMYGQGDHSNEIVGVKKSHIPYEKTINNGTFQLIIEHFDTYSNVDCIIIHECQTDDKGNFFQPVGIYWNWYPEDIRISLKIKKFVYNKYEHFYQTAKLNTDGSVKEPPCWGVWYSNTNFDNRSESQMCLGTYELESGTFGWDGMFDVKMGTLGASFAMSSDFVRNELLGSDDYAERNQNSKGELIYSGGIKY